MSFNVREYQNQQDQNYPVEFHGDAREFFGIWIVNIMLTIVTFGIYSAWAKVRTQRYFYGNTFIDGHSFEYHAKPEQILKGRLIVFGAFMLYSVIGSVNPTLSLVMSIALLLVLPILIVASLRFNARVTSYRNIHFNFIGTKGRAFLVYAIYPFLSALTLFTAYPLAEKAKKDFYVDNHQFGGKSLHLDASKGSFFRAFYLTYGLFILSLFVVPVLIFFTKIGTPNFTPTDAAFSLLTFISQFSFTIFFFLFFIAIPMAYRAMLRNLVYNNTTLDGQHKFISNVSVKRYLWIAITNAIITILTIGLMRPWAAIRMARYVASATSIEMAGSLNGYATKLQDEGGALGSEYTDIDGIDVGVGL